MCSPWLTTALHFQSGMGTALTEHFLAKGWKVALFDLDDKSGKKLGV